MAFNNGYIGRSPGDSSVVVARQTYQPTGVQTDFTFSANYDVGYLDAYINGVRLIEGLDYTATDGSVVGLTTFAQNGDVVELIAYKAFTIADVRQSYGNFTVGANLEVVGNISAGGSVTAPSFYGDLTGDVTGNADTATTATYATTAGIATYATTAGIATYTSEWILESGNGNDYGISGPGLTGTENDPTFYLTRGQQYKFTNNLGAHPFRIQSTPNGSVGAQYNDGITNNDVTNGTLTWNVQFDAPDIVYYQCTVHPSMGGKIYIVDAGVASDVSVNTSGIITATSFSGNVTGNVTGTATTATTATNVTVADESSDTFCNVLFVTAATGDLPPKTGSNLTFNSSSGRLTAVEFSGGGSGLTDVNATTLDSIDSGSFLRSDAADTKTSGNLTFNDNINANFGTGSDLEIYHNGTDSIIDNNTGDLNITTTGSGDDIRLQSADDIFLNPQSGENGVNIFGNGAVELYYDNSKKLETTTSGVTVTGISGNVFSTVTSTATSKTVINREYCAVTASGQTITLPASPSAGDEVIISVGNFTDTVIARNGSNIMGLAENITVDVAYVAMDLVYIDATRGWRIS